MIGVTTRVRAEMPGDQTPLPRAPGWQIATIGLVVLLGNAAHGMIVRSAHPTGYKGRHWDVAVDGPWPYPTDDVRTYLIVMALDTLFGIWFLQRRSKTSLALRSLAFGLINLLAIVAMVPLMMHAGEPLTSLLGWFLWATAWGLLFALCAGIAGWAGLPAPRNPP